MDLTKYSDSFSDGSLDLLVQLVDADVVNELLDGSLIISAAEHSSYFNFDENVIEGRT
jgi:hypothetical protein